MLSVSAALPKTQMLFFIKQVFYSIQTLSTAVSAKPVRQIVFSFTFQRKLVMDSWLC